MHMSQCVAVCCSVLQCVAVCCSVLQCGSAWLHIVRNMHMPQCAAVCCSVLQCVAVCGSVEVCVYYGTEHAYVGGHSTSTHFHTLPHTSTHCNTLGLTCIWMPAQVPNRNSRPDIHHSICICDRNTLQQTATHYITPHNGNTCQHTATNTTHCNTLQHTATHCNTLQHITPHDLYM